MPYLKVYSPLSDQWNERVTFPPHYDNLFIANAYIHKFKMNILNDKELPSISTLKKIWYMKGEQETQRLRTTKTVIQFVIY